MALPFLPVVPSALLPDDALVGAVSTVERLAALGEHPAMRVAHFLAAVAVLLLVAWALAWLVRGEP